jgi:hypothetical protein
MGNLSLSSGSLENDVILLGAVETVEIIEDLEDAAAV